LVLIDVMFKLRICVQQHDATDCGAACLATIVRSHGLRIPIARIRQYAGTDLQGTNVLGLVEAAQRLGFEAKGVRGGLEALARIPLPAIAHVRSGGTLHYVVIHKVGPRRLTIADPASGVRRLTRADFAAAWSGVLVLLVPGAGFGREDRPAGVWSRLARLVKPHGFLLAETFLATLFFTLLGLGTSIYIQLLVDHVLVRKDWATFRWLSLGLLALTGCRAVLGLARGILSAYLGRKIDLSLMLQYYRHVLGLPMQFFDTRRTGEVISRLNDAVKIREAISGATLTVLVDGSLILGGFAVLGCYNLRLAFGGLAVVPVLALVVLTVSGPLRKVQRSIMEQAALLQSGVVESLTGIAAIKAFGAEEAAAHRAETGLVGLLRHSFRAAAWACSSYTTGETLMATGAVGILWMAGGMVMRGEVSVGQLVASYSIVIYILQPMLRMIGVQQTIQDAFVAAQRLGEILDLDPEFTRESGKIELRADTSCRIDFRNVTFRYGSREEILHDVTLQVPPGSVVVLAGRSGSGKTTLAKLLLRFYEATSGQVEIDGYDVRDLNLDSLRSRVGYVDHEAYLFSGTIGDNVTLGDCRITLRALIDAIREAGLESLIAGLPDRHLTPVGERGLTLSGGQRQRLAIARAIARDPRILILDEATSNLDPHTERSILESLSRLKRHCTVIIITHRLSAAPQADQILVLDKGRIVEQGTHRQLIEAGGLYRGLWSARFGNLEGMWNTAPVPEPGR
jgi:ATP-binding cassette subfamily B protein